MGGQYRNHELHEPHEPHSHTNHTNHTSDMNHTNFLEGQYRNRTRGDNTGTTSHTSHTGHTATRATRTTRATRATRAFSEGQGAAQGRSSLARSRWPDAQIEVAVAKWDLGKEQQREKREKRREKREERWFGPRRAGCAFAACQYPMCSSFYETRCQYSRFAQNVFFRNRIYSRR